MYPILSQFNSKRVQHNLWISTHNLLSRFWSNMQRIFSVITKGLITLYSRPTNACSDAAPASLPPAPRRCYPPPPRLPPPLPPPRVGTQHPVCMAVSICAGDECCRPSHMWAPTSGVEA